MPKVKSQASGSKYFRIYINPLQIHENFERGFVDTTDNTSTGLNDSKLVDTSKRKVTDRLKTCPSLMDKTVIWAPLIQ